MLVGLLLVAIEEVVVGNKVVDVVIVLAVVGDVDEEIVCVPVVAALVEAVKENIDLQWPFLQLPYLSLKCI